MEKPTQDKYFRQAVKPADELFMFEHTGGQCFPMSFMMKLMSQLTEKFGPSMLRSTVNNVRKTGFEIVEVDHVYLDVVKIIRARAQSYNR